MSSRKKKHVDVDHDDDDDDDGGGGGGDQQSATGAPLGASFDGPAHHKLRNHSRAAFLLAWPSAAEVREYSRHTLRIMRRSKVNFTLGGKRRREEQKKKKKKNPFFFFFFFFFFFSLSLSKCFFFIQFLLCLLSLALLHC
jgi:hypothetical protein